MSDSIPQPPQSRIASALIIALSELTVVERARTAHAGSYSYDYASMEDVVRLTRPVLAKAGIVALTPVHAHGDGLACTVTLLHSSGEYLNFGPFPFPHGQDAQKTGSAVTYHRRYALVAALGMAAGDDDDGAAASQKPPEPHVEWTAGEREKIAKLQAQLDNLPGETYTKAIDRISKKYGKPVLKLTALGPSWIPWLTALMEKAEESVTGSAALQVQQDESGEDGDQPGDQGGEDPAQSGQD